MSIRSQKTGKLNTTNRYVMTMTLMHLLRSTRTEKKSGKIQMLLRLMAGMSRSQGIYISGLMRTES